MGVRGLSSYVKTYQRSCSEHVELSAGGDAVTENKVRLAVDGLALVYYVMQNPGTHTLHLELGCDYLALARALGDYLSALAGAGVTPLVIVDGMQDAEKEGTTLKRRRAQAAEASAAMDDVGDRDDVRSLCSSLLPLFATEALVAACRLVGVHITGAEREADPELAAACRPYHSDDLGEQPPFSITARQSRASCSCGGEYHQDATSNEQVRTQCVCCHFVVDSSRCDGLDGENCDGYEAVLSNDSDFLAMDIPGYIPFWSLGVGEDGSAGALIFRRSLVAARLSIPEECMPDLACLVGNDWLQPDARMHKIIMDEGAGRTTNVNNKKRKGASHHSGGNTARAGPARDLVEAAGRFIARVRTDYYLRNPPLAGHGHANEETLDDSTGEFSRLICSRFFPRLGCTGGNKLSDEGSCVRPPKNIGGKSKSKGKGSRGGSKSAKAKRAATAVTIDNAPVLSNHGAKGRASTGVRNGEAGGDHGMDEAETAALAAEVEEGEAFLRKFLAAKRHYEVPTATPSHSRERPNKGVLPDVSACAGSYLTLDSTIGRRAGIDAPPELAQAVLEGVFWCRVMVEDSPVQEMPSTPQSVPDPPLQMARTGEFHKGDGARDSDSRDHCAEGESASAFGMFADVRRGLYQLCLALLLGAQNRIRASGATSTGRPPDPQARGTQDLSSSPCPANGRVKPSHRLPTGHRHNHGRSRSLINDALLANHQGMLKATDARDLARSLEHASNEAPEQHDGDEWHIKEFRRVGDTVKPFVVICQIPPPLRLEEMQTSNEAGSLKHCERWKLCLSTLGLKDGNNAFLNDLVRSEMQTNAFMSKARHEDGAEGSRMPYAEIKPPCGQGADSEGTSNSLAAVALVAAVLLRKVQSHGGFQKQECEENQDPESAVTLKDIVMAFVAAATHSPASFSIADSSSHENGHGNGMGLNPHVQCGVPVNSGADLKSVEEHFMCDGTWVCACSCSNAPCHTGAAQRDDGNGYAESKDPRGTAGDPRRRDQNGNASALPNTHRDRGERATDTVVLGTWYTHPHKNVAKGVSVEQASLDALVLDEFREQVALESDRHFAHLWSQVQAAVWHVNACVGALAGSAPEELWILKDIFSFNPLRMHPALALDISKKRCSSVRRRRSNGGLGSSREQDLRQASESRSSEAHPASTSRSDSSTCTRNNDCVEKSGGQSTTSRATKLTSTAPWRNSALRSGAGISLKEQGNNEIEERRFADSKYATRYDWLAEGCRGKCPWAKRVAAVLEAAESSARSVCR